MFYFEINKYFFNFDTNNIFPQKWTLRSNVIPVKRGHIEQYDVFGY